MAKFILASGSPRRRELLTNMGVDFEIVASNCEEVVTRKRPLDIVRELSKLKADNVRSMIDAVDDTILIAADTLVFLGDERLGKPRDEEDAFRILSNLSGNRHRVITGVTILRYKDGNWVEISFTETTNVNMAHMSDDEIREYISTGEPMDKAGAYAIQGIGAKFVESIDGDYSNVVGLPVPKLYSILRKEVWL